MTMKLPSGADLVLLKHEEGGCLRGKNADTRKAEVYLQAGALILIRCDGYI